MANVKFDGIDEDLTAPNTPWIYYGVSICMAYLLPFFVRDAGVLCRGSGRSDVSPLPGSGLRSNRFKRYVWC